MQPIDAGKRAGILAGDRGLRGVLTLQSFVTSFRVRYSPQDSRQQPSLQQLGAFLACFVAWPVTNRYGRHKTLALASAIFVVGADIQTIDTHAMGAFYPGRVIAGVGLGAATVVNLIYSSEMTAKHLRGQIAAFPCRTWSTMTFSKASLPKESMQWQIPIGLQIVPAALLGLSMLTLKESTRWLTQKDRHEEA
ncbi:uncharacterized protein CC84DRAFT_1220328 [Paraphaeosphaeria sporulosa]|uniref:Major facilitator superfamily (MFS) profile domain-containing protein n=1 Tax=Paraphaeosphaeria sporulosa TaxID=1460663 RepID=A0A177C3I1_9PLEO|nr:uncharacterized protein CC84DRAFT_1220328 [Paraphaeosphaeria sporulosa]OAG01956.1 hypothetical protein CC84DRAFT_1220328 [Paraphaeosphaeria sporulosa]